MTTTTNTAARFEVGTTYATRSACDWDCIYRITVVKRTERSVWIEDPHDGGKVKRRAIVDCGDDVERFFPWGRYSMAPMISATRPADGEIS